MQLKTFWKLRVRAAQMHIWEHGIMRKACIDAHVYICKLGSMHKACIGANEKEPQSWEKEVDKSSHPQLEAISS